MSHLTSLLIHGKVQVKTEKRNNQPERTKTMLTTTALTSTTTVTTTRTTRTTRSTRTTQTMDIIKKDKKQSTSMGENGDSVRSFPVRAVDVAVVEGQK